MKKWFVEFPTYQYNEDVKELAVKNGLKVVDAQFDDGSGVDGPKLTKKGEKAKPPKAPKVEVNENPKSE